MGNIPKHTYRTMGNIPKHTYRTMGNIPKPFRAFLLELSNHPRWRHPQLKGLYRKLPLYTSILWFLLGVLTFPCNVQCLIFKVGVLGPWDCDPLFSKALPNIAAQLAVDRANNDVSLDLGYKLDFVVLREDCETSTALSGFVGYEHSASAILGPLNPGYCDAATLLSKNWDKAIFSWACINYELDTVKSFPTFSRTLPSPTRVLFSLMKHFSLANVGIVSSSEDVWVDTASRVADSLRNMGLPVGIVISLGYGPAGIEQTLQQIKSAGQLKIIIMCMHSVLIGGEEQAAFLVKASEMGLTDGRYIFLPYDTLLYSLPYKSNSFFMLGNNSQLREAYDSVLTITVESGESSFYEAFDKAKQQGEIKTLLQPEQVSPLFGTIYNGIYLMAKAMDNARKFGVWVTGTSLPKYIRNVTFNGFNQRIGTNVKGDGVTNYVILDSNGQSSQLYSTYVIDMSSELLGFMGRSIHFPGGAPPPADSTCWFDPYSICNGGVELTFVILVFALIFTLCLGGVGLHLLIRRHLQQNQLVKGPNKMVLCLEDLTFISPQMSKRKLTLNGVSESKSTNEGRSVKSTAQSQSMKSIIDATQDTSNIAVYEGDWVWLKKFEDGAFREIRASTTSILRKMKDLRNENVNPFLGFFSDSGVNAVVTEHCSRGSLQDLLRNDDVKLDWMFKSSLLLDLIKGMKYLHHRDFPHGRLKSRNCVVDGRFVLKITDYGFNELLEAQKAPYEPGPPEELFWTAPEFLRDVEISRKGTYKGDVYSFAIILQEVVVRGSPYCMLGLSPEEIIRKVKKPPPMCRPTVAPDQAPLECIQMMKQCWSEQPDRRPAFDDIFDQFKTINKGKKTNIIDSMLRMLEQYSSNLEDLIRERTEELEVEKQRTEKLLAEMLPPSVAEALKTGGTVEPEYFDEVTIYFSDIVGFTTISALSEPIEVVNLLNDLYTLFDAVLANHDVYKVETIGDAYMVASGLPKRNGNKHAAEVANMSLDILSSVGTFKIRHMPDVPMRIRIGLHSGSCVAGVVGLTMPRYCLFGDTINTASRMESTSLPYRIHVNQSTVKILRSLNEGYLIDVRGKTELKGKGIEETYWLVGKKDFQKPLPSPPDIKPGDNWQDMITEEIKSLFRKANRKVDKAKI
ncbi:retinal guanylyl cyclase 2 isoform X1 [Acipenser ruthenus]|uniref:retinal guanylyl cyclase 2 isoform X1 n=1 Tax=Acipenser ruthenus TaxID=7906 RepID=UPI002741A221|nr:retinal guanylyl cyclase 2 isoform X1 [Acipenser ruthenus]XP_058883889.1 retinal guanylyl cyclase 2 isoform X1 [Acipenser ruthenus]